MHAKTHVVTKDGICAGYNTCTNQGEHLCMLKHTYLPWRAFVHAKTHVVTKDGICAS